MPQGQPPSFRRARRPEQIEVRRQMILQAAVDLFERKGFEAVALNDIAKEVGLAKSNLYNYFENREHIYLEVLQGEGAAWERRVLPPLKALGKKGKVRDASRIIVNAFAASDNYCVLISAFSRVLEKNLSPKQIVNFRSTFFGRRTRLAQELTQALPGARFEKIYPTILLIFMQVGGLWPFCHHPRAAEKLFGKAEFSHLKNDFRTELTLAVQLLLTGALHK
jgi:AcrR family transcriptional regulator